MVVPSSPASFGGLVPFLLCPVYIIPHAFSPDIFSHYACLSPPLFYIMCTNCVPMYQMYTALRIYVSIFPPLFPISFLPSSLLSSPSSSYVYLPYKSLLSIFFPSLPLSYSPLLSSPCLTHSPSVPPFLSFLPLLPTMFLPTSPTHSLTHWKQDLFMIDTPISVKKGDMLDGVICIQRNKLWRRHLKVHISYTHSPISSDSVPQVMDEWVL